MYYAFSENALQLVQAYDINAERPISGAAESRFGAALV